MAQIDQSTGYDQMSLSMFGELFDEAVGRIACEGEFVFYLRGREIVDLAIASTWTTNDDAPLQTLDERQRVERIVSAYLDSLFSFELLRLMSIGYSLSYLRC